MVATPEPLSSRLLSVRDVLAFTFDFEVLEAPVSSEAYSTPSPWVPAFVVLGADATVVGQDAMGGVYVHCEHVQQGTRVCLHVDTQGCVVRLGRNLDDALALVVALPYWHELFAQCRSGELLEMRELATELELRVCEDLPALPEAREYLRTFLGLPTIPDPVSKLQELNSGELEDVTVLSPHGWRYESPRSFIAATGAGNHP